MDGLAEAQRRISECLETQGEELDLGGLGLDLSEDAKLWQEIYKCEHVRRLYLGLGAETREKSSGSSFLNDKNKTRCSLPGMLITALSLLEKLDVESCLIDHLPDNFSDFHQLKSLNLRGTGVRKLGPVSGLKQLTELKLWNTRVLDLAPLSELTKLIFLELGSTDANDLSPLSRLTQLRSLNLWGTSVDNLSHLSRLMKLTSLIIVDTGVINLEPLSGLTQLTSLKIMDNTAVICDLGPLSGLRQLTELMFWGTGVIDFAPLSKLTRLIGLDLTGTNVTDLSPLSELAQLRQLNLADTNVTDLSPLFELAQLRRLNLESTGVSDLIPLSGLLRLTELNLRCTNVVDLVPLSGLKLLTTLNLSGCKLSADFKQIWFMDMLKVVKLANAFVPSVPQEVLSRFSNNNCLDRLRNYFKDLDQGREAVKDIKLIILGNGRVGKTQICRRLQGKERLKDEEFNENIPSTHGIQIATAQLNETEEGNINRLQIWDFGGQDIYHGTHALFLRSQAVFLLVWAPEKENSEIEEYDGLRFRNQLLSYWVNYVRQSAGQKAPILIVQTRCDSPEDRVVRQPVPDPLLEGFSFEPQIMQYSAKTDRKRAALNDALLEAASWLQEKRGAVYIGKGWATVKHKLEVMRDGDQLLSLADRKNRTIDYDCFLQICDKAGDITAPEDLLHYLHDTGIVFYQQGLFADQIILDQQWALEAIYAVLDRGKSYKRLLRQKGRFTLTDLGDMLWDNAGYSRKEQELFLSMMLTCGICFQHRQGDERHNIDAEYIAPDLLPEEPDEFAKLACDQQDNAEIVEFLYDLLMPGLLRGIISDIGNKAGLTANYWQDGLYVFEAKTGSRGMIRQVRDGNGTGSIQVRTSKGEARQLLDYFVKVVERHEQSFGVKSRRNHVMNAGTGHFIITGQDVKFTAEEKFEPEYKQEETSETEYFVSYGMNTKDYPDIEKDVDRFCDEAEKQGVKVVRDRKNLRFGESIPKFMDRVGAGERIIIFMSEKYLQSESCMYELYEMWRTSKNKGEAFLKRVVMYPVDEVDIASPEGRLIWIKYWKAHYETLAPDVYQMPDEDREKFDLMNEFYRNIGVILVTLMQVLQPGKFDDLMKVAFENKTTDDKATG